MEIRANTLSLTTKLLACSLVTLAIILQFFGFEAIKISEVVIGATFIAGSFLPIDISKIKTSQTIKNEE